MILLTERIEAALKNCFQKHIQINIRDKKLINGKLLLYNFDCFYIILKFQGEDGIEQIEIPYPFNAKHEGKLITFDYRLESLAEKDFNLLFALQSISKKRESKFYNSILSITQA